MKRKLSIAFALIIISLIGIIVFQFYWTANAYRVNKKQFDNDIDTAMVRAMDDCKKDYFDSIRVVMIKEITSSRYKLKVEEHVKPDSTNNTFDIKLELLLPGDTTEKNDPGAPIITGLTVNSGKGSVSMNESTPFTITKPRWSYYKKKIVYKGPQSIPALVVEMSFYEPRLLQMLVLTMQFNDFFMAMSTKHNLFKGSPKLAFSMSAAGSNAFPPNYKQADSVKLNRYYKKQLVKLHIDEPYQFKFSDQPIPAKTANNAYSETSEYKYKFHGFTYISSMIGHITYTRVIFDKPQYGILKNMLFVLLLSAMLVIFTGFCFYYVSRTIVEQKNLAVLKDDFINNMTHELKTPIATITVAIEGLQSFNVLTDEAKTKRYLQTSRDQLERLNQLVTKVLNVAAFENNEIGLNLQEVDIDDLFNKIIVSEQAKTSKTVNFNYINRDDVKTIHADQLHLNNILLNLVDNAVKYAGDPVEINITVYKAGSNLIISVKDNGMGIPPEHLTHIFDKFYRVPTGNVHNVKGTGLGLNYVKYIVEAHSGSIAVKSEVNNGSEFIVTLPLS